MLSKAPLVAPTVAGKESRRTIHGTTRHPYSGRLGKQACYPWHHASPLQWQARKADVLSMAPLVTPTVAG